MRLENWFITDNDNGYMAPEMIRKLAIGNVYGHPNHKDGKRIHTNYLTYIDLKDKIIHTQSGSIYELGEPDPKYAEWLKGLK